MGEVPGIYAFSSLILSVTPPGSLNLTLVFFFCRRGGIHLEKKGANQGHLLIKGRTEVETSQRCSQDPSGMA